MPGTTINPHDFHPDLRAGRWLPKSMGKPPFRWIFQYLPLPTVKLPPPLRLTEHTVQDGVSVRVFSPSADGKLRPVLFWIHGDGYILGSAKHEDKLCVRFVQALDMVVVAVEYRLAPKHPYLVPVEDCFAAFEWMHREAAALGIDPERVIVGGSSAGGGLAATLTLLIHDRKRPKPLLQLLVYPMLDDRNTGPDVARPYHRVWDQESNVIGWSSYLGKEPGVSDVPAHAAAARREDLGGLPPTWIGVGTLDLFHDEDVAYADRLRKAGVPTTLEIVPGAFHGFDIVMATKPVSVQFFDAQVATIKKYLGVGPAS